MDRSRLDARTVALALLCVAVVAFAAATLDSTTTPEDNVGIGDLGGSDQGFEGTPTPGDPGEQDDARPSILDLDAGRLGTPCVAWLKQPLVQAGLVAGLVALFFVGRWYDDAALGLSAVFLVGYPGFFLYLLLTACRTGQGFLADLSTVGRPQTAESGGLLGGTGSVTSPTVATQLLLVLVVGLLGVVAVLVLTSDHEQLGAEADEADEDEEVPEGAVSRGADVAAIGEAAGRAADRLEEDGAFENEVYRAWAEMTDPLDVAHPESSTPGEFAEAAVDAGMARDDVDRLTALFAEVRYGGAEPTAEREREAVATLRRIEDTYAGVDATADLEDGDGGDGRDADGEGGQS